MKILTVIPFEKGPFGEELTYFSAQEVALGSIVEVPLRNKKILGFVIASDDVSTAKSEVKDLDFNLKKISGVKENSIFSHNYFQAILETSKYFAQPANNSIASLTPALLRDNYDLVSTWSHSNKRNTIEGTDKIRIEKLLLQTDFESRISFYKTLIRGNFAKKQSVFIVLPTEIDVIEFEELLGKGIEQFTFAFYGNMKTKKAINKLEKSLTMEHAVLIIGTPMYLSLPRNDISTIILEKESSPAYKMQFPPYLDLRIFTEVFASLSGSKLYFADTLLRFETFARKDIDDLVETSPLSFRLNFPGEIKFIPRITERNKRQFSIFTDDNIAEIEKAVTRHENIFVFSLRKGLATYTICRDCNDIVSCDKCRAPLVLYQSRDGKKRMFICNRCSTEKDPETTCALCGSWNLMPLGIGADGVYEELKKNFPKTKIFKLDKEEVTTAKDARAIVKEFENSKGAILLGTQMALFYLRKKVSSSIIASFDTLWSIPNFLMGEKVMHLLQEILERTSKQVIIISKNIDDPILVALQNENLLSYARSELNDRKSLSYPPYMRFIKISHNGSKEEAQQVKTFLERVFGEFGIETFRSFSNGKYNTSGIIRLDRKSWSLPALTSGGNIDMKLFKNIRALPTEFAISIDPENIL